MLLLGIFASCLVSVGATQQSVEALPKPASLVPYSYTKDSKPIQVAAGSGTKGVDSPLNELGVEVKNLEKIADPSVERRSEGWFLKPVDGRWFGHSRVDLSRDQKARLKFGGPLGNTRLAVEGGYFQDNRPILYIDNFDTPYTAGGSFLATFPNQRNGYFGKASLSGDLETSRWEALSDYDFRDEGVYAGAIWIGRKNQSQGGISARIQTPIASIHPFAQFRTSQFTSVIAPLTNNSTEGWRAGFQSEWQAASAVVLKPTFSRDQLNRILQDKSVARFNRTHGGLFSKWGKYSAGTLEWSAHAAVDAFQDQLLEMNPKAEWVWDAGVELSTSRKNSWGWSLKGRRFVSVPSPTQRFGDGALLQPSPDLPSETGVRSSTGPWLKLGKFSAELNLFAEDSKNAPIMIAVTPGAAQTQPLGGLWVRGADTQASLNLGKVVFNTSLTLQQALNASALNWQKGHGVPGYPNLVTKLEMVYQSGSWLGGFRHRFRNTEAMDLTGMWYRPPLQIFDSWVGYTQKTWEARLVLNNLFPNYNLPQNLQFQGSASPNLLEPSILQREVRLVCEFLI